MLTSPLRAYRVSGTADGIKPPLARHALQLVDAAVGELDPRTGDKILDRARHEHLAGLRHRGHAGTRRHGNAAELAVEPLAFSGVQPDPDLEAERLDGVTDRT